MRIAIAGASGTLEVRLWSRVNKHGRLMPGMRTRCWEWLGAVRPDGYGVIGLGRRGTGTDRVHRVVWRLRRGEIPRGKFVLHRCDNRPCVRHLFLGTQKDNVHDCIAKGRHSPPPKRMGMANNKAKLTDEQKLYALKANKSGAELSVELGVNRSTINRLRRKARSIA